MFIPKVQSVLAAGLALTGIRTKPSEVTHGKILDYAVEECVDSDGLRRCSAPFFVRTSKCYNIEWNTDGALSHTTVEVRDTGSSEIVFYRDTNGEWTPDKDELVYIDFKPKVWKTGNDTVEYSVKTCS